ncbi:MAG TPA: DUF58 domain-containing protein [Mycobacteriales bacterium]|jgi:uncharacterized protein (DUF58 family)|nr:DUF58 domain-containing protein [Mycobacteriales bacterium]
MRLAARLPATAGVPAPGPPRATIDGRGAARLHLEVGRRLDGLLQGNHLGLLPGPGSEPAEARSYLPGDDVRRIDWSVSARTMETHVRDAVAERELETTLVVDLTGSMAFGTSRWEKRELAISVAAAFAHLAQGPGDRTGALVLAAGGLRRVPPRSGRQATLALLHSLLNTPRADGPGPGLADALGHVLDPPRRRGLVVVVSDLLDPAGPSAWTSRLRRLAQRHDVLVAEVLDPRELALPDVGVLRLVDPETGRELEVQTSSPKLRQRYAEAAAARRADHAAHVRAAGAGHVVLRTDGDWLRDLAAHLQRRRRTRGVVR